MCLSKPHLFPGSDFASAFNVWLALISPSFYLFFFHQNPSPSIESIDGLWNSHFAVDLFLNGWLNWCSFISKWIESSTVLRVISITPSARSGWINSRLLAFGWPVLAKEGLPGESWPLPAVTWWWNFTRHQQFSPTTRPFSRIFTVETLRFGQFLVNAFDQ